MAISALERLDIAQTALQRAGTLSGGQQQRVAIARALMQQPKVMLADEPIASLDPLNAKIVMDALRDINLREGITVITNLHTLDTARAYCNRIIGMAAGKVVFDGPPEELTDSRGARRLRRRRDGQEDSPRRSPRPAINAPRLAASAGPLEPASAGAAERLDRRPASRADPALKIRTPHPARSRNHNRRDIDVEEDAFRRCFAASPWRPALRPRRGHQGIPRRHPRRRKRSRPAAQLPVPRRPPEDRLSASRRSRCSRPPTMTASSRACSAARSTSPSSALRAMPRSTSRTRRRSTRSSPPSRPTARPAIIRSGLARANLRHQDAGRHKGKKLGYADPDSTSGYLIPLTQLPKDTGVPNEGLLRLDRFQRRP